MFALRRALRHLRSRRMAFFLKVEYDRVEKHLYTLTFLTEKMLTHRHCDLFIHLNYHTNLKWSFFSFFCIIDQGIYTLLIR